MSSALSGDSAAAVPAGEPSLVGRAPVGRRVAAAVLDVLLLGVYLGFILVTELALVPEGEGELFQYGWALVFSPLYFALYHAYGTGATPGQLELRTALRDLGTAERPSLARSLARAYLGLAFLLVPVLALVDLLLMLAGRSLRDRITRTTVVAIALHGEAPELAEPTIAELEAVFEPPMGTRRYLSRGWALLSARPRLVIGPVAAVYAVLAAIAAVLAFLLVADVYDPWAFAAWVLIVVVLLASGVYWTQAALVTAVEEIRVGAECSIWRTLALAARRANALSVALVGVLLLVSLGVYTLFLTIVLVGRFALVAPALVLEDTRVLAAFRRSWVLTRGQTWRLFGLLLLSFVILSATVGFALTLLGSAVESAAAGLVVVGILAVVLVVLLAWVGASWSLVYEDARRARPPRRAG